MTMGSRFLPGRIQIYNSWPTIGIRKVDRLVGRTVDIPRIENVNPFWRPAAAWPSLGPNGISAESNLLCLDHSPLAQQFQRAVFFQNDHTIYTKRRRLRQSARADRRNHKPSENWNTHSHRLWSTVLRQMLG